MLNPKINNDCYTKTIIGCQVRFYKDCYAVIKKPGKSATIMTDKILILSILLHLIIMLNDFSCFEFKIKKVYEVIFNIIDNCNSSCVIINKANYDVSSVFLIVLYQQYSPS